MLDVFLQRKNTHIWKVKMRQNNEVFFSERKTLWQANKFVKSMLLSVLAFAHGPSGWVRASALLNI